MRKILFLFCLLHCCNFLYAQNYDSEWLITLGDEGVEVGQSISLDTDGNIYITGVFSNRVDFDPGPDIKRLISAGEYDVFILKLNPNGEFIWVRQISGSDLVISEDIKIGKDNSIYITGSFKGKADFDPGPDTLYQKARIQDIFVLKLSTNGDLIWARQFVSEWGFSNMGNEIALNHKDDIIITGIFDDLTDFDPGPETYTLNGGQFGNAFTCKLNSEGEFIWAKAFSGFSYDAGESVTIDGLGNVYVSGSYEAGLTFDEGQSNFTLVNDHLANSFIAKLDSSGNFQWAKDFRNQLVNRALSIRADEAGNTYVSGYFEGWADFDPGPSNFPLTSKGESDAYIVKLDSAGALIWAKQFSGNFNVRSFDHTLGMDGVIYSTGYFKGRVDFDPGPASHELNARTINNPSMYICMMDGNGSFIGAQSLGGDGVSFGRSIYIDEEENIYTTGNFTLDLNSIGDTMAMSNGDDDFFVYKVSRFEIGLGEHLKSPNMISLYPNPTSGRFSILTEERAAGHYEIFNVNGQKIGSGEISHPITDIEIQKASPGFYFLRGRINEEAFSAKIIKH